MPNDFKLMKWVHLNKSKVIRYLFNELLYIIYLATQQFITLYQMFRCTLISSKLFTPPCISYICDTHLNNLMGKFFRVTYFECACKQKNCQCASRRISFLICEYHLHGKSHFCVIKNFFESFVVDGSRLIQHILVSAYFVICTCSSKMPQPLNVKL